MLHRLVGINLRPGQAVEKTSNRWLWFVPRRWTGSGTEGIGTSGWPAQERHQRVFRWSWTQNNDTNEPESCIRRLSGRDNELVHPKVPARPAESPMTLVRSSTITHQIFWRTFQLPSADVWAISPVTLTRSYRCHPHVWRRTEKERVQWRGFLHSIPKEKRQEDSPAKVTWYNPPYSSNVATNIGRRFRSLINKDFPKASKLHQIFNSNTLKVSYSCMPSVANVSKKHNCKILGNGPAQDERAVRAGFNCRNKELCPLEGVCQTKLIVYKASVETDAGVKEYTGLTATTVLQPPAVVQGRQVPEQYSTLQIRLVAEEQQRELCHQVVDPQEISGLQYAAKSLFGWKACHCAGW